MQQPRVESDLHELLFQRVKSAARVDVPPAPTSNKWLLSSALHKSIRRGHAENAQKFAASLLEVDPAYLWRRLPTITVEEIGVADVVLCGLVIESGRATRFRQKIGERQLLLGLIEDVSRAVKSRALHDHSKLIDLSPEEFERRLQQLPWLPQFVARHGRAEGFGFAVPDVMQLVAESEFSEVVVNDPDDHGDELIGGLPAATYDKHCREGQAALRYLMKCPPFRDSGFEADQVGLATFMIEGRHLDRELMFSGRHAMQIEATEQSYRRAGLVTRDAMLDVVELVRANRELLNRARRRVLQVE